MNVTNVQAVYQDIVEAGLLEDRREYNIPDLKSSYQLDAEDANLLHRMIQGNFVANRKVAPNYNECVAEIEANPEQAVLQIKDGTPANLHAHIDRYLVDMSNSVDNNVTYDGLQIIGDFMLWCKAEELFN